MINPVELRIGNKISLMHDASAPIFTIQEIRSSGVMGYRHSDQGDEYHEFDWLLPIALTPDILIKLGMKRRFDNENCNIWDMKDENMRNGCFCLALLDRGWVYPTAPGAVPFHYFHQLQNLYFALTGNELTISNL